MALQTLDLWTLVLDRPRIDPRDLTEAIVAQSAEETLDYRTRLLIRDSVEALRVTWGAHKVSEWLSRCPLRERIESICKEEFEAVGFPSLKKRIMEKTQPEKVRQFFEFIGNELKRHVRIYVAGSIALIVPGYVSRRTEDVDVVGEVPEELRKNHHLLSQLEQMFALQLGHVQTHYFPMGWQERAHSLDSFGYLQVFLLDVYDVFLSKLFSSRMKDKEDLIVLVPQLDKSILAEKLKTNAGSFLAAPRLLEIATENWRILYGEPLPQ